MNVPRLVTHSWLPLKPAVEGDSHVHPKAPWRLIARRMVLRYIVCLRHGGR